MAQSNLPAELRKTISKFSADAQAKVVDLHKNFAFDDDLVECFAMNHGGALTQELLHTFELHLKKEAATPHKNFQEPSQRLRPSQQRLVTAKRKRSLGVSSGVLKDIRAMVLADDAVESTPMPRKTSEIKADLVNISDVSVGDEKAPGVVADCTVLATNAVSSTSLQVSIRLSINGQLDHSLLAGLGSAPINVSELGDLSLWRGRRSGAYEWMDESVEMRASKVDERLANIENSVAAAMFTRHLTEGEAELEVGVVGVPSQAEVVLCGRVACEGLEGKLNERSILLEGSRASSHGASVRLYLDQCKGVVAFPGQIVSVLGRSGITGSTFHARDFCSGLPLQPRLSRGDTEGVHMMVAAGPFCLQKDLDYSPLSRVFEHAMQRRPDVLLLLGPFVDASHNQVRVGKPVIPGDNEICPIEDVYTHHVLQKLRKKVEQLTRLKPLKVLIVPSLEETLCFHPMPQPPLDISLGLQGVLQSLTKLAGVKLVSNPAHLEIAGLRVSVTSADALSPVLKEVMMKPEGKKIDESLRQLLLQRNLFPVLPRDPPQVSEARAQALGFPNGEIPDVCIFPSQCGGLTCNFVEETAFVNPGSVCRPLALGSFAEIWVGPSAAGTPLSERTRVDMLKLS